MLVLWSSLTQFSGFTVCARCRSKTFDDDRVFPRWSAPQSVALQRLDDVFGISVENYVSAKVQACNLSHIQLNLRNKVPLPYPFKRNDRRESRWLPFWDKCTFGRVSIHVDSV